MYIIGSSFLMKTFSAKQKIIKMYDVNISKTAFT